MLGKDTYREWTEIFMPGSHYEGDWSEGSKMLFLAPSTESGKLEGMVSRIRENRPYEYISIEHLGVTSDGREAASDDPMAEWAGAHENYAFSEKNGATEVSVEMDTVEEYREMFLDAWPKALRKLKELSEK